MTIQIDKIKGILSHKHKAGDGYEYWKIKTYQDYVKYGYLYSGDAVMDPRGIAADNWHVSTKPDWENLAIACDSVTDYGHNLANKTREIGLTYWRNPNVGATNETGFNLRGSGMIFNGEFGNFQSAADYWIGTPYDETSLYNIQITINPPMTLTAWWTKSQGKAVRLVKDFTTLTHGQTGTYTGPDGRVYPTICIGIDNPLEWLAVNLAETKFKTGELIPKIDGGPAWVGISGAAYCAQANTESNAIDITPVETLVNSHDIVEFVAGENIKIGLINKTLTISSPGGRVISDIEGLAAALSNLVPYSGGNRTLDLEIEGIAIVGAGTGPAGYGVVGMSDHLPIEGTTLDTTGNTKKRVLNMRGDSAHTVVNNGYGLSLSAKIPVEGWTDPLLSERTAGNLSFVIADKTQDLECVNVEIETLHNGVMKTVAVIDHNGNLKPGGLNVYSGLLSQAGTANPTAALFKNDILAPDWVRTAAGTFTLTKAGAFTDLKTIPIEDSYTDQAGNLYLINRTSADVMTLQTFAAVNTSVLADGVLNNRYINIEIYS